MKDRDKLLNLKPSEFYHKYWFVELPDGRRVHPQLDEKTAFLMDQASSMGVDLYFVVRGRGGTRYITNPVLEKIWNEYKMLKIESVDLELSPAVRNLLEWQVYWKDYIESVSGIPSGSVDDGTTGRINRGELKLSDHLKIQRYAEGKEE